ncbi:MAG: hypothetical protein AB7F65_04840 [Dehalococcoidia bacterium]
MSTEERRRAVRLTSWTLGISLSMLLGAAVLATLVPTATEGARAFLRFCGVG